jgi:hypothetical protein
MNDRERPSLSNDVEAGAFNKKKSHTNLQATKLEESNEKHKVKKLVKMMSE